MKKYIAFLLLLAMALSIAGCAAADAASTDLMEGVKANPITAETDLNQNSAAVTDFGIRLFQNTMQEGENTLISPLSVIYALSMTANGADGETLAQMEEVLGLPVETLNEYLHAYMERLPEEDTYKLSLANGIWFKDDPGFTVEQSFLQTNADYYGAGIYKAPFDGSVVQEINDWVKENTDGMIEKILDEMGEDAVMYLVNALAFDAEWQSIYKENQIRDAVFTTESGEEQNIKLMYSEEDCYLEDEKATGVIKYYDDGKYAFVALLPNEGVSVAEYVSSLTGEHLNELLSNPQHISTFTRIPKFETEYDKEMSDTLISMGMVDAFDADKADFSRLGKSVKGGISISRVIHKTTITVDEKGTEAGAATVIEVTEAAMAVQEEPKTVYLDRPFVYMLVDCETNLPFFIGTMMDMAG